MKQKKIIIYKCIQIKKTIYFLLPKSIFMIYRHIFIKFIKKVTFINLIFNNVAKLQNFEQKF